MRETRLENQLGFIYRRKREELRKYYGYDCEGETVDDGHGLMSHPLPLAFNSISVYEMTLTSTSTMNRLQFCRVPQKNVPHLFSS